MARPHRMRERGNPALLFILHINCNTPYGVICDVPSNSVEVYSEALANMSCLKWPRNMEYALYIVAGKHRDEMFYELILQKYWIMFLIDFL